MRCLRQAHIRLSSWTKVPSGINGVLWRVGDRHDITFPARPGSGEKDLTVRVRYIGEAKDNRTPGWIQNGDMMKNKGYFWVWTTVPGSNIPRWIDP